MIITLSFDYFIKEISIRTEPLHQAIENLSKQQQPIVETLRELRQSQLSSEQFSSKFDQSIKAIQTGSLYPFDLHWQLLSSRSSSSNRRNSEESH